MRALLGAASAALLFLGCQTIQTDEKTLYRADIQISAPGVVSEGMAIFPAAPKTQFKFKSKARLDLLMISSCHRTYTVEKVDPNWFGGAAKEFTYVYEPTEIEKQGFCPLLVQALDKSGETAWGWVGFRTEEALETAMECNGTKSTPWGVWACQSQVGMIQSLSFKRPIRFVSSENCSIEKTSELSYSLRVRKGFCYATFTDGTTKGRLVLFGFEKVLVRE